MNTSLAKKPAAFMREHTQEVRDHSAAMARLTDQYLTALNRAKAQYFDGVKRITDAISAEVEGAPEAPRAADGQPASAPGS